MFHRSVRQGPLTPSSCKERIPLAAKRVSDSLRNRRPGKFAPFPGPASPPSGRGLSEPHWTSFRAGRTALGARLLRSVDECHGLRSLRDLEFRLNF